MTLVLGENRYGKSRVRLMKVNRDAPQHSVVEWTVDLWLQGAFESSFEDGNNAHLLPTDTMKNTVYSLARESRTDSMESFGKELASHFIDTNPHVDMTGVQITATGWSHIDMDGHAFPSAFIHGGDSKDTTTVMKRRDGEVSIDSGFEDLWLLKTAKSGFAGFMRDNLTTLKETNNRLLGTLAKASWRYMDADIDFHRVRQQAYGAMLKAFAAHDSLSVQQTLYAMAAAALEQVQEITEVYLSMPNKHCNLVDLSPFGQDNPNMIFVPTDEPHGSIEARVKRGQ